MTDPETLLILQRRLTVAILVMLFFFLLFQVGGYFADVLRIFGISLLTSYMVINAVDFLDRHLKNRALAILLVYVVLLGVVIVGAIFVIPAMVYQVSQLIATTVNTLPELLHRMTEALVPLEARFRASQIDIKAMDIVTNVVTRLPQPDPGAIVARVTDVAMSTMTWVLYSISIFVVTFYILLDGHRMKEAIIRLFPGKHHQALSAMALDMDRSLQAFFKGQIVLGLLFGLVMLGVYVALGVQYALLLSVFLAVLEVLPVVGPPIGFAPAAVAVAVHGSILPGARLAQILILTLIFVLLQQVKDNIVAPRYIGNVIGLHPVMIFLAIMIGARVDGMLGIILSLPAACVLNVVANHLPLTAGNAEPSGDP